MTTFETLPNFQDNIGQILSAEDLHIVRQNAILMDALSFRNPTCFDMSAGKDSGTQNFWPADMPFRIWHGFLRFQTGMTSVVVTGRTTGAATLNLRIQIDGITVNLAAPQTGFTSTSDITGVGYTDGQIIAVTISITGSGASVAQTFFIHDVYGTPISLAGWPGVPTFTTATINATKLSQLNAATQWLFDRMSLVPMLPQRLPLVNLGPFRTEIRQMWFGSVQRAYTEDDLSIEVSYTNFAATAQRTLITLNGVVVYAGATNGPGFYNESWTVDLSGISVGDTAEVGVYSQIIDETPIGGIFKFSRMTVRTARSIGNYTYAATPHDYMYGNLSPADLVTHLNQLSAILSTVKTRIDATVIFSRGRAIRRWYGFSEDTRSTLDTRAPIRFTKSGSRLLVYGQDVKLCWGAIKTETSDKGVDFDKYSFANEEQIIDADMISTKVIYLDSYANLYHDQIYYLVGDVSYAAEYL